MRILCSSFAEGARRPRSLRLSVEVWILERLTAKALPPFSGFASLSHRMNENVGSWGFGAFMRVLITGATGFVGKSLARRLKEEGHHLMIASRDPNSARSRLPQGDCFFGWNPEIELPPQEAIAKAEAIINLAGEPIAAKRWSPEQRRRIYDSRVLGTRNLLRGILTLPGHSSPQVLISASAVGYYGDRGDEVLTEGSSPGSGFLSRVCRDWENEAAGEAILGMRVLLPRIGMVLGREGGALQKLLPLFRWGLGGPIGNGRQWVSWIHIDDLVSLLVSGLARKEMQGPMNAVAPEPVTNEKFSQELGRALHRPAFLRAPRVAMQLMLGEMSDVVLSSQRAVPEKAREWKFEFGYPTVDRALGHLVRNA